MDGWWRRTDVYSIVVVLFNKGPRLATFEWLFKQRGNAIETVHTHTTTIHPLNETVPPISVGSFYISSLSLYLSLSLCTPYRTTPFFLAPRDFTRLRYHSRLIFTKSTRKIHSTKSVYESERERERNFIYSLSLVH